MSIFNWINKIFNINTKPNSDLPSEFQLPIESAENINAEIHNIEFDDFSDSLNRRNQFENDSNMFNLEDIFRLMELEFQNIVQDHIEGSDISTIPNNQSTNKEDLTGIPKKNFIAQSTFLNPSPASRPLNKPSMNITIKNSGSQYFEKYGWSSSRCSYVSKNWNGRIIEKETCTNQSQDGITETVITIKDGNKKCVETITENSKNGEKIENLQLSNLDRNEMNDLKNQFSKF